MRIRVATRAIQIVPAIDNRRLGLELRRLLVAIGARHGNVATSEHEAGLLMFGQTECGWLVSLQIVAAIAGVEVWRRCELASMLVGVTVCAALELDLEESRFPFRNMALGAFQTRMSALQWVCAQSMFLHCERGGFPAVHGVARGTFSAVRAFGKLAVVGIGLVAIHALLEYERLFEVSIGMALVAIHAAVFALQGELCLGVIKTLIQRLSRDLLPTARVVAGLAGLPREACSVRVFVAVRALSEANPCVLWFAIGAVGVTLRALHLGV